MQEVMITQGLPASGKTTYAKKQLKKGGWKRINKDDLRAMLDDGKWSKSNEKFVLLARDILMLNALREGYNVIIDDTNFAPKHIEHIRQLVDRDVRVIIKVFDATVEECIERDLQRPKSVGAKVIRQMYNQYLKPKTEVYDGAGLPKAIICDIDGTLAIMGDRSPYDWAKVGRDALNLKVARLITLMRIYGYKVILVSGRDSECLEQTLQWLKDKNVNFDSLIMRPEGDKRKDCLIKEEIFEENIRGKFDIEFVLDDRNQVVEMWRDLGLTVLQVAEGDF